MNKKLLILTTGIVCAAALAGCGPAVQNNDTTTTPPPSAAEGDAPQTNGGQAGNPFGGKGDSRTEEAQKIDLPVEINGEQQTIAATFYQGTEYVIAIPDDWVRDGNEPQWNPRSNDDVELTLRYYPKKKADKVVEAFMFREDDYVFEETKNTSLLNLKDVIEVRGTETDEEEGSEYLIAYFKETERGTYGILLECPEAQTAAYGGVLGAMANTFTLKEEAQKK